MLHIIALISLDFCSPGAFVGAVRRGETPVEAGQGRQHETSRGRGTGPAHPKQPHVVVGSVRRRQIGNHEENVAGTKPFLWITDHFLLDHFLLDHNLLDHFLLDHFCWITFVGSLFMWITFHVDHFVLATVATNF